MDDGMMLIINDNGEAEIYDDTYDLTIHCTSEEEKDEALRRLNSMQWIPCSERLPLPDDNPVIVSWMGIVNIGWYSCGRWETGTRLPMGGVEAWMPLPEPWKGEEHD